MKTKSVFCLLAFFMMAWGCGGGNAPTAEDAEEASVFPVTFDAGVDYPKKIIVLNDVANVSSLKFDTPKDMFIMPRGSIYVADNEILVGMSRSQSIWRFTRDGKFLNVIGRSGRGPGELVNFGSYFVDADDGGNEMVYMTDLAQNKVVVFTSGGTYLRQFPFPVKYAGLGISNYTDSSFLCCSETRPFNDRPMTFLLKYLRKMEKKYGHLDLFQLKILSR